MSDSIFFRFVRDGEDVIAIRSDAIQSVIPEWCGYNSEIRIIHSGGRDFWEAYQLMKQGVFCRIVGEKFPYGIYRYANDRWETISSVQCGEPTWNGEYDTYEFKPFIVEVDEWEYDFHFPISDLDATWETVDCSDIPRIEDRGELKKSPQQAAKDEAERIERERYRREHPPISVDLLLADVLNDTSRDAILKSVSDIGRSIQEKQNEAIAEVLTKS